MTERFYFPGSLNQDCIELDGSEAHHLVNVLHMKEGDSVVIFNGEGEVAQTVLQSKTKRSAVLKVTSTEKDPESRYSLIVASAVPKGDRFRWMIEKLTELNVLEFIPLATTRSVVDPGQGKISKMEQTMISACKQSGRNRLMKIQPVINFEELFENQTPEATVLLAHPGGEQLLRTLSGIPEDNDLNKIVLLIGPEGGLTDEEVAFSIEKGAGQISLGNTILRMETAAISGAATIQAFLETRKP